VGSRNKLHTTSKPFLFTANAITPGIQYCINIFQPYIVGSHRKNIVIFIFLYAEIVVHCFMAISWLLPFVLLQGKFACEISVMNCSDRPLGKAFSPPKSYNQEGEAKIQIIIWLLDHVSLHAYLIYC
jgi:hypothetical protein